MFCTHCGKEIDDEAVVCMGCGCPVKNKNYAVSNVYDANNTGFNVLSFLFPIVGFILYLVWKNDFPIKAHGCGKWALISFIIGVVFVIFQSVIGIASY